MIYLDNNATTELLPEVREAMLPFLGSDFANPSSPYQAGRKAALVLAEAREHTATLIKAFPSDIVFTSGGTESSHTAVGMARSMHPDKRRLVISSCEHPSVYNICNSLFYKDLTIVQVAVSRDGRLDLDHMVSLLTEDTLMLSVMTANNETGVLFPVEQCAALAREQGILFHTDAVQAVGKIPVDVSTLKPDFLSISGHKFHAPKGVGGLYIRPGLKIQPVVSGGDQESGRRAGTENMPGIAGLGAAAQRALQGLHIMEDRVRPLRDRLEQGLRSRVDGLEVIGASVDRLPNTSMLRFDGLEAEALLARLDMEGICCSTGSACSSGSPEPSHVLVAMGYSRNQAEQVLRFSLGRLTSKEEIDRVLEILPALAHALKMKQRLDRGSIPGISP